MRFASLALALLACGCGSFLQPPSVAPRLDPDLVQRGAGLFLDVRVSGDGTRSCATCHPGGGSNGRTYRAGEPVDLGTPDARRSPTLRGLWQTAPYLWDGSLAQIDDAVGRMLAVEMRGSKLAGRDREALVAYLNALTPLDRGRVLPDGRPREPTTLSARRGREVFAKADCARCHPAPAFMRPLSADVGTGGEFDVPTLRGIGLSGPFGHDARYGDLESIVRAILAHEEVTLSYDELSQLLSYLELL